jgi:hypothetical protein
VVVVGGGVRISSRRLQLQSPPPLVIEGQEQQQGQDGLQRRRKRPRGRVPLLPLVAAKAAICFAWCQLVPIPRATPGASRRWQRNHLWCACGVFPQAESAARPARVMPSSPRLGVPSRALSPCVPAVGWSVFAAQAARRSPADATCSLHCVVC